jgi:hypothetical protein
VLELGQKAGAGAAAATHAGGQFGTVGGVSTHAGQTGGLYCLGSGQTGFDFGGGLLYGKKFGKEVHLAASGSLS